MFDGFRKRLGWKRANEDSDDEDDSSFRERVAKKIHSRRPPNTAFRQQRLKSWQPVLTPKIVIPFLLLLAVIFIPIGIGIYVSVYKVEVVEINYGDCDTLATADYQDIPKKKFKYHFKGSKSSHGQWKYDTDTKTCTIRFDVPTDIKGNTYLYYKLTNFYQNHRKYVESYDWKQLRGEAVPWNDISKKCEPMRYRDDKIIYPAGLVANSMFNDTISNLTNIEDSANNYEFSYKGIAWKSDVKTYKPSQYNLTDIVPPINWLEKYPNGYTEEDLVMIASDEHFMNWMKTAAMPTFMKLYGKNNQKGNVLHSGTYEMEVVMNYPVSIFGGTKTIVISTSTVFGGRHFSLSICYLVAGGISLFFMIIFLIKQLVTRNKREHAFFDNLDDGATFNTETAASRTIL